MLNSVTSDINQIYHPLMSTKKKVIELFLVDMYQTLSLGLVIIVSCFHFSRFTVCVLKKKTKTNQTEGTLYV